MVGLEAVLQDFGEISRNAFALAEEEKASRGDATRRLVYSMNLHDLMFFEEEGLVWWGGKEGFMPEIPIGKPEDYVPIREDYSALKSFIERTLDRGRVHAGGGTHGDSSRETNCAEYVAWMYNNSENKIFKRNVERAVNELLVEEFGRKFVEPDIGTALRQGRSWFEKAWYEGDVDKLLSTISGTSLRETVWRLGFDKPITKEDEDFVNRYTAEVRKTERPVTLNEVLRTYAGGKEKLTRSFEEGRFSEKTMFHCDEIPDDLKEELKERYIGIKATKKAVAEASPQFNKLIGLLDVVAGIGDKSENFTKTYEILREKAESKFRADSFLIKHFYSVSDIFRITIGALASVQKGKKLEEFWLGNIRDDNRNRRAISFVYGALMMYSSSEERRDAIPKILVNLGPRISEVDQDYDRQTALGFIKKENILDDVVGYLTEECFEYGTFSHLDKENVSIDVLEREEIGLGEYSFKFIRYSRDGVEELDASFDIESDLVLGDARLEKAVREYLKRGYELPGGLRVSSLAGRKVDSGDSKVVDAAGNDIDGQYEGVIGINSSKFGFLYDSESDLVLLSEPISSRCMLFGGFGDWESSRADLGEIEEKMPYSQFLPLGLAGQRVDKAVAEKRGRVIGDSLYSIEGKLCDEIAPYVAKVISGRLIS